MISEEQSNIDENANLNQKNSDDTPSVSVHTFQINATAESAFPRSGLGVVIHPRLKVNPPDSP